MGIEDGALVRVSTDMGAVTVPVRLENSVAAGQVFIPIHWSDQFSSNGCVGSLVASRVDPWSGQPESKSGRVQLQRLPVHKWISLVTRLPVHTERFIYWHKSPAENDGFHLLAALGDEHLKPDELVSEIGKSVTPPKLVEYEDTGSGDYRCLLFDEENRLAMMLFSSSQSDQFPNIDWSARQLGRIHASDSWLLLAGRDMQEEDQGALVCSCFEVGVNTIRQAIQKGASDPVRLGQQLRCGTNCGSCIPELKKLVAENKKQDDLIVESSTES